MHNRGFTILELIVVTFMIGALIVSISGVANLKSDRINKVRVTYLQEMAIALDEYKSFCRFYPATLDNGLPDCDYDWLSFRPDSPNNKVVSLDDLKYVRIARMPNENRCYGVHLGIQLEDAKDLLTQDDDFYATGDLPISGGDKDYAGCSVDVDFDGREAVGDSEGYYDIFLK